MDKISYEDKMTKCGFRHSGKLVLGTEQYRYKFFLAWYKQTAYHFSLCSTLAKIKHWIWCCTSSPDIK